MASTTSTSTVANLRSRESYLLEMRKRFCPPEMVNSDTFELREEYFRPPKPKKILTVEEEDLIAEGIEKFGFGEWKLIVAEYFPEADVNEVRIKAMELVGKQDFVEYIGKKMTREELNAERLKNLEIGKQKGLLVWGKVMADERYGVLI